MKKTSCPTLTHPVSGDCINVTEPDSTGKRQRVSESGHAVVDVRLPNGERRTLLLSSFTTPSPPSAAVAEVVVAP